MDQIFLNPGGVVRTPLQARPSYHKMIPGVQFDPNGIAQGYTVDLITFLLQQQGISNYMVEVGGETRCGGMNAQGRAWQMQIDKPLEGDQHVQETVVPLQDKSLATSGNYRKFIEIAGSATATPSTRARADPP